MSAPSSSGRWKSGVAKTLSTMSRALACCAISATAAMSISSSVGLDGLSRKNAFVFGRTAFRHASRSRAVDQRRGDAEARQEILDDVAAGAEQRRGRRRGRRPCRSQRKRRGDRGHAARHRARRLGAFEQAHALLEHGDGRIGVARIDEARILALEARLGGLRAAIDEALGQEDRLGGLAELRAERAAMHQLGRRAAAASSSIRSSLPSGTLPTKNPAARPGRVRSPPAF